MQLREARLNAGDKVIVTGVTGALASVLAMLAPAFGVQAIGLSRRVAQTAVSLNATVLDSSRVDLAQAIVDACGGERPNAAIDNVSSPEMFDQYFPVLRNGARIIVSGAIGTPDLPVLRVPAQPMYTRSISLIGIRTADYSAIREFWGLVRDGFRLPHDILHEQPLETAATAHRRLADGTATGHTILRVSPTEL
jgi:NADPH:quinone reductase-like Zn-dependent oxidoreductase